MYISSSTVFPSADCINFNELMTTCMPNQLVATDVKNVISEFNKKIYSYNCEDDSSTETFLSILLASGRNSFFDLILQKGYENDVGFFKKLVSCYLFSGYGYDQEICFHIIRYCLNSNDISLQKSGINLLSFCKTEDDVVVDAFKDFHFTIPYLNDALEHAIKQNV